MKKKIITFFIITIILVSFLFVSCGNDKKIMKSNVSKAKSTYNPFNSGDEKTSVQAEFSFGPVNLAKELSYTGNDIEEDYFYDNSGDADCKFGFMIFIDGIPQSYKIDGESSKEIMHQFSVKKKNKVQFKVSFSPNTGKKGDKLGLYAVTIFNPNEIPSPSFPSFGNNHKLSQVLPVTLNYLKSADSSEPEIDDKYSTENVTEEIKKEYLAVDKNDNGKYVSQGVHSFYLKFNNNYKKTKIELKKNSKLNLTLEGLCDPDDARYRTTVFIDNKPVKTIDGKDYLEMQLKKGMLSKQSFEIDTKGLTGNHIVSTISVPVGNDYNKLSNQVVESNCKLLIMGE